MATWSDMKRTLIDLLGPAPRRNRGEMIERRFVRVDANGYVDQDLVASRTADDWAAIEKDIPSELIEVTDLPWWGKLGGVGESKMVGLAMSPDRVFDGRIEPGIEAYIKARNGVKAEAVVDGKAKRTR